MSMPARYDITHFQGDTFSMVITLNGNFSSSTMKFEIKSLTVSSPAALELFIGSGITVGTYNPITGQTAVTIGITAAQSLALGNTTIYQYDFEITTGSTVLTYLSGSFAQVEETAQ